MIHSPSRFVHNYFSFTLKKKKKNNYLGFKKKSEKNDPKKRKIKENESQE